MTHANPVLRFLHRSHATKMIPRSVSSAPQKQSLCVSVVLQYYIKITFNVRKLPQKACFVVKNVMQKCLKHAQMTRSTIYDFSSVHLEEQGYLVACVPPTEKRGCA